MIESEYERALHCGTVVHAIPLPETERSLTILLRRTLCHLENWIPLLSTPPLHHLSSKLHSGWVYDRPGHVPLIESEAEAWVLKDGEVLADMGVTERWLTAVTALRMSETGFSGVKPGLAVQGHQKARQLPDDRCFSLCWQNKQH